MVAGHAALGLLIKARRPRPATTLLIAAAFGPDLLEWAFAVFGNHNRELSHSIIAVALGAMFAALAYAIVRKSAAGDAIAVAIAWLSHWPADFLTGIKPTWPGGPNVGLNLYSSPGYDFAMESGLVIVAWLVYRRTVNSREIGRSPWLPVGLIAMQGGFALLLWGAPLPARFDFLHLSR
jgi:membrane-bound metal-dependent hydrolase YbcI (DUF457 family)